MLTINYDPIVILFFSFGAFVFGHILIWFVSRTGRSKTKDVNPPIAENFKGCHVYLIALNCSQGFEPFPEFQTFLVLHGSKNVSHQIHVCKQGQESSLHLVRSVGTTILLASTAQCLGEIQSITVVIRGEPGRWRLQWIQVYDEAHAQMWRFNAPDSLYITTLRTIYSLSTYLLPKRNPMKFHNWFLLFHPQIDEVTVSKHDRVNLVFASFLSGLAICSGIPIIFSVYDVDSAMAHLLACFGSGCLIVSSNSLLDYVQHVSGRYIVGSAPVLFWQSRIESSQPVLVETPTKRRKGSTLSDVKNRLCICDAAEANAHATVAEENLKKLPVCVLRTFPMEDFDQFRRLLGSKTRRRSQASTVSFHRRQSEADVIQTLESKNFSCSVAAIFKSRKHLLRELTSSFDAASDCSELSSLSDVSYASSVCNDAFPDDEPHRGERVVVEIHGTETIRDIKLADDDSALKTITVNSTVVASSQDGRFPNCVLQDALHTLWIPKLMGYGERLDNLMHFFQHWQKVQHLLLSAQNCLRLQTTHSFPSFMRRLEDNINTLLKVTQAVPGTSDSDATGDFDAEIASRRKDRDFVTVTKIFLYKSLIIFLQQIHERKEETEAERFIFAPKVRKELKTLVRLFCYDVNIAYVVGSDTKRLQKKRTSGMIRDGSFTFSKTAGIGILRRSKSLSSVGSGDLPYVLCDETCMCTDNKASHVYSPKKLKYFKDSVTNFADNIVESVQEILSEFFETSPNVGTSSKGTEELSTRR